VSLCASQKKAVSAVLSRRREKQNGSSLFIRLRFHLAHSRSTSTQCVFMHKQKLPERYKLFRASTSKISLLIFVHLIYFRMRSPRRRCTPFLCISRCTYVSGVQKIALLFKCEYARWSIANCVCVCGKSENGANFRVSFVYTSLPISATQKRQILLILTYE